MLDVASGLGITRSLVVVAPVEVVDVPHRRVGAVLSPQLEAVVLADQLIDVAVGVVEVAEGEGSSLTGVDTGRRAVAVDAGLESPGQSVVDALGAEVALLRRARGVGVQLLAHLLEARALVAGEVPGSLSFEKNVRF